MGSYIARRAGQTVVTLLVATFLFHAAVTVLPGDPIRALFGIRRPDPQVYAAIQRQFGFDDPYWLRYRDYLFDLARGDLGYSFPRSPSGAVTTGPKVSTLIAAALPVSLRILGVTLAVQVVVGIAAGVMAAMRRRGSSGAVYVLAILIVSIPVIVVAYVAQAVLALELGWLPVQGVFAGWRSYILPVLALSGAATAYVILLMRSELMQTLQERFLKAAYARSIPRRRIVAIHALRASLLPVVTFIAANLGQLVTGLLIVEGIFNIPGVGGLLFSAILSRDQALLVGIVTFITLAVIVANLFADLLFGVIDPRIRLNQR